MLCHGWKRLVLNGLGAILLSVSAFANFLFAADWTVRPVGGRQVTYKGKLWPPFPRPTGKEAKCIHQYHYGHYWPFPQNCEDRNNVRSALNTQVAQGWIEATTLYDYHFDKSTNQLNSAGLAHLEYILFRVPSMHRSAFVQMSKSGQIDQLRLANVQESANELLQGDAMPSLALRRARAYGTSAQEIDMISRNYLSGTPTPRLPISSTGSGGGSGDSGAGGGGGSGD